ncbi:YjzD family protein [Enterococcus sp. BWB1-3]|uniref:YjzD family protein n=1 Tax=unclassified Enterococcus TaxID=2608891 RepID=UPI001923FCD0|nr:MULTISPECIES: YjzD family protein [unclassified Enterococcus]MBL1229414.1 YjzD family protein [Enterococcus sp. BWB1-3]MCB5952585.1 YjzD family protein [Enterococcus sp. BWT-B8]MCB5956455.1 YjzD family protein [Enterococcus sp. CWB-B31]
MRYIIILFWSFLLGQIVGYIGGALNNGSYDFMWTTIISLIAGVLIISIGHFALPEEKSSQA